ncbi:MAG: DciA family protein [Pseudomonadota bacterium]
MGNKPQDNHGTRSANRRRRKGSTRRLGAIVPPITRKLVGRKAMRLADLLEHWPDVVGVEFAKHTAPIRLIPGKDGKPGALHVAISAGFAPIWQHAEPQLLARINDYLGQAAAISRVALKHQSRPPEMRAKTVKVGAAAKSDLAEKLSTIEDATLRNSLERLGLAILSRQK